MQNNNNHGLLEVILPADFETRYLSYGGAGFSIAPYFTQSAWFRFHNRSEGIKNLYLVGAGTHPGPRDPKLAPPLDHACEHRWKGLGAHAAIVHAVGWPVVVEAGELPVAEPVHRPQQLALGLARGRGAVCGVALLPNRPQRLEPRQQLLPIARLQVAGKVMVSALVVDFLERAGDPACGGRLSPASWKRGRLGHA